MNESPFNSELDIKKRAEAFIREALKGEKPYKWESEVWPMVKLVNPDIDERVLRDIYDLAAGNEKDMSDPDEESQIVEEFKKEKIKTTYRLARYLCSKYSIITIGEREREMYVYKGGMYVNAENEVIFPEIQRILGENVTKNAKNETFHKIADATSKNRSIFTSAPVEFIPLKNGVYNTRTKELLPHSPEYKFMYQFPIVYDINAICPKTEAFFKQVLSEEQAAIFEEWLGYYFYRLYSFKKAVIFVGEGNTGKTTLLEVIINLLGKENISSISLHKMSSDRFSAAHLYRKHGNLVDELSASDISDTGAFKMATGGGSISGEYKYGNQFSFPNFSKFTFACNKIPSVADFDDEAYFDRWMVIKFDKTIVTKIPNFIETLTTDEERSGLFNLAMRGLERLLKNGKFSYDKSAIETKIEMMRSGSSIARFVIEAIENKPGEEITKEDMYDAYTIFCTNNNLGAETKDMFGKKFLFNVGYATEGLVYDTATNGKRVRGWRNVGFIPTEQEKKIDENFQQKD